MPSWSWQTVREASSGTCSGRTPLRGTGSQSAIGGSLERFGAPATLERLEAAGSPATLLRVGRVADVTVGVRVADDS